MTDETMPGPPTSDAPADPTPSTAGIEDIRTLIQETLRPHLDGPIYALLDFPDHSNAGDCAIWLGEAQVLRTLTRRPPTWVASFHSFDSRRLRMLPQAAPIFLHGGGNVGDLWPVHQLFREQVLTEASDRRIVILTQSIQFRTASALERARRAFGNHPHVTLLVCDADSLEFARSHFDCASKLCPDFALALDLRKPANAPSCDLFWLLRADKESAGAALQSMRPGWLRADWPQLPLLGRAWLHRISILPARVLPAIADSLAHVRMMRGLRLFCGARAVVTDRLHGHVLSTLLGIPNVLLPDAFGKNRGLYETWTHHLPGCAFADTPAQALAELENMGYA